VKNWRIVTGLLLCLVLVSAIACNPSGNQSQVSQQLTTVTRGDLAIKVSASGNIAVAQDRKLTFGIGGRVDKIYVKENDEISKGAVLAKLETDALELALAQAKVAVTQAQVTVTEAEVGVSRAKVAVTQAGVAYSQAQAAVTQAQAALQAAEFARDQAQESYTLSDIKVAQSNIDLARIDLDDALLKLSKYVPGSEGAVVWGKAVIQAQARLDAAKTRLDVLLSGSDTAEVAIKKRQVEAAKQSLEAARQALEATSQSLELAKASLELTKVSPDIARQSLELARQSQDQAQKQLDRATLIAPFAGVVAHLYDVEEGDMVSTATTILYLIDPSLMELKVQVDEIDIPDVKLGQKAIVKVDALPDMPLAGKVSSIAPIPVKEAGVTLFDVKIALDSTNGTGLRSGMSASSDIMITERTNVLLVPDRVIKQNSQGKTVVDVAMVGGQAQERVVVTGISDGFQIEIISGLKEGETLAQ